MRGRRSIRHERSETFSAQDRDIVLHLRSTTHLDGIGKRKIEMWLRLNESQSSDVLQNCQIAG